MVTASMICRWNIFKFLWKLVKYKRSVNEMLKTTSTEICSYFIYDITMKNYELRVDVFEAYISKRLLGG